VDIERQKQARETLLTSAKHFLHAVGWSQVEWEGDEEVLAFARAHGVEREIEHISAFAKGLRGRR